MALKKITFSNGLECFYNSSEAETEYLFDEIFTQSQYSGHNITIGAGDVILDVGANIGLFSLYMTSLESTVRIFAFEPIKPTFEALQKNIALHSMGNVVAFNYGLGAEHDPAKVFTFYPNMAANSTARPGDTLADPAESDDEHRADEIENIFAELFEESEQVSCEIRTLSSVIDELGLDSIDLLKVDVEGEEYEVFRGIDRSDWPKIKQVVAEVHDQRGRLERVTRLLEDNGFQIQLDKREMLPSTFVDIYHLYAVRKPQDSRASIKR